jgi:hypothetical protein
MSLMMQRLLYLTGVGVIATLTLLAWHGVIPWPPLWVSLSVIIASSVVIFYRAR